MNAPGFPRELLPRLAFLEARALMVGGAALGLTLLLAAIFPAQVLPAYLVAYLYFIGIALGSTSFLLLHNLTGGGWGAAIRRPLEAGAKTLAPLVVLFLPIVIGAGALYPWVNPDEHMAALIAHKRDYLSVFWFTARAAVYFAVWAALAFGVNWLSSAEDATDDPWPTRWMQAISGPGLALLFLLATFATIDWAMSLEPEWYSTIYSAMIIVGWGLTTFAVMTVVVVLLIPYESVPDVVTPARLHDLGNLMLAFVMLWAYLSFSQYLIIWAGQLSEEIPWYLRRGGGGWEWFVRFLMLFHFFAPFGMLLFRETKRKARYLLIVSAWIAAVHLVNMAWLILPSQIKDPLQPHITWWSLLALPFAIVGIGGTWLASFLWFLQRKPLLPVHLPAGIEPATGDGVAAPAPSGGH